MAPSSEPTLLESEGQLREYKGVKKLRGKKVVITGGESVSPTTPPAASPPNI